MPNERVELRRSVSLPLLVFYASIGFEDMVKLAEEVRQPQRTLPRGILLALELTALLYLPGRAGAAGRRHGLAADGAAPTR